MKSALIIVDVQNDFLPGGALAVESGGEVIPQIQRIADNYDYRIFTQDYHPAESVHFERWPVHCVAGTPGAELDPAIAALIKPGDLSIVKGTGNGDDGYSAFEGRMAVIPDRDEDHPLADLMRGLDIEKVDVAGLAFDFCVEATARDAAAAGFTTRVVFNATRSVRPEDNEEIANDLEKHDVEIAIVM